MHYRTFSLVIFACAFAMLATIGCQGSGGGLSTMPTGQVITPPAEPMAEQLAGMPTFPPTDEPGGLTRLTAAEDNILLGTEFYSHKATGVTESATSLVLDASGERVVWGMWRWGIFGGAVVPLTLELDVDPAGGEYWLAVAEYQKEYWRIFGPYTESTYLHTYDVGINHVSPDSGYAYVILLADEGSTLTVNQLNMTADNDVLAPVAPTGLVASTIQGMRVELTWTANAEPDLDGYDIYSGPGTDFPLGGPGVTKHGSALSAETSFWVESLEGETEYFFRITAFDALENTSPPSNTATATTLIPSQDPTNLRTTDLGGSWADLAWDEPPAGTPLGYEVYTGPGTDFEVGEPGVTKHNSSLVPTRTWRLPGLIGSTEYNCRVRAYYPGGPGPLSNVATFTTEDNSAPIPSFTVSPQFVESGEDVIFNPFGTTDEDTPPEELIFKWDYDNDGTYDHETTGPEFVTYVFNERGLMTTKLTVNDGLDYSTTRDFYINYNYEYFQRNPSTGRLGEIIAVDTDPGTSRIAVLHTAGTRTLIQYFNGTTWTEFDASYIDCSYFSDVALSPDGASVLVGQQDDSDAYWTVFNYNGTSWSETASVTIAEEIGMDRRFAIDANGRISVIVLEAYMTGSSEVTTHYLLYVWHEKSDGTFNADNRVLEDNNYEHFDVKRNSTTSYFIYGFNGNIQLWEFTDGADTDTAVQSFTGDCDLLTTSQNPSSDTEVSWSFATDDNRLYYGDNFGTANGSQYHSLTNFPTALLGTGLAGDNETVAYWCDEQTNGTERILEYDSITGGGTETLIGSDSGLANSGGGQYFDDGTSSGVYTCVDELRDGEITGRFMVGGSVETLEWVYTPSGDDANILTRHIPLIFPDDSVLVLNEQVFATVRASSASSVSGPFTDDAYGIETWCTLSTACITAAANEFFVASYRSIYGSTELELNRFTKGTSQGTTEAMLTDTTMPRLIHHPVSDEVLLITGNAAETSLAVRSWNGTAWSGPSTIHSGANSIECYTIVPRGTEDWGLVLIDDGDNLRLIESTTGVWGAGTVLATDVVNGYSGVGFDYHTDGSLAIAVERNSGVPGVFLGIRPDGGILAWEEISPSTGNVARHIWTTYQSSSPQVLYYLRKVPTRNSRMQIVEKLAGTWNTSELPDQLHGNPVQIATDSSGNIIIAGYNLSADPRYAAIGVLMQ